MSRRRAPSKPVALTGLAQGLAFLLEVVLLVSLAVYGFRAPLPWGIVFGIGLPAAAVVFWGTYMAPKAPRRLPWPLQPLVALALFLLGSFAFAGAGQPVAAALFALVAVATTALSFYLRRRN